MQKQPVIIKSTKNGISLVLDDSIPFGELLDEIKQKFVDSEQFFKNAKIAISFEGRTLDEREQAQILAVIEENTSISIICVIDQDDLRSEMIARRIRTYEETHSPQIGQFYKGTLRSGQQYTTENSLIVLGDVNPGAVVSAGGNIVILGALKGTAYAGTNGDDSCFVAALEMQPVQIKIGNYIGRAADKSDRPKGSRKKTKESSGGPQIATVYEQQILIEPISSGSLKNI